MADAIESSARGRVVWTLASAAGRFPRLGPVPIDTSGLDGRDAALAVAVHRACLQRWITIEHLLDRWLKRPAHQLEPALRAVLLAGAAQLLFFDRLPPRAVVHESVELGRTMVRPGAAAMVNAVLRRLADLVVARHSDTPWQEAPHRIPLEGGHVELGEDSLPPVEDRAAHLSIASGHPRPLVDRWLSLFGPDRTRSLCLHGIKKPPTFIASPQEGERIWTDSREDLVAFLAGDALRRVQDPAAALPVKATRGLQVHSIIDYCAGRGTKTRQLLAEHPRAQTVASDADPRRLADLARHLAQHPAITVLEPPRLHELPPADLLILDVPCTNTGVLARRPEARYRFSRRALSSLIEVQRNIIDRAVTLVCPGGHVLYSTCSLDHRENQDQVAFLTRRSAARVLDTSLTMPAGSGRTYHDGGYYALLQVGVS